MTDKLPTWEELKETNKYDSFDGDKNKTELTNTGCKHEDLHLVSGTELTCRKCGSGWVGSNIKTLYNLLSHRP